VTLGQGLMKGERYKSMKNLSTNYQTYSNNVKDILLEYKRKLPQNETNSQNIYDIYLAKVNKDMRSSILSRPKADESAISKVRRLSKEIESDLEDLKLKKNTTSNNLKLKPCLPKNDIKKDKKSYFLELQKRKLKLL
jgi:DNA-binding protein Fis